MKKLYLPALLAIFLVNDFTVFAQQNPIPIWPKAPSGKYVCFTDEMEKYRRNATTSSDTHDAPFEN